MRCPRPKKWNQCCSTSAMASRELRVLCDNLRSLYNVGSIFRTSDACGISHIYLAGITGTPAQAGLTKVSLGAELAVPWEYIQDGWRLVDKLKREGWQIVSLEQTKSSVDIAKFKPKAKCLLIVGNEVDGVNSTLLSRSDAAIEIPMIGVKESLNVAVAYGIAAYLLTR